MRPHLFPDVIKIVFILEESEANHQTDAHSLIVFVLDGIKAK